MIVGQLPKDSSSMPKNGPSTSFPSTDEWSSPSIRFHKYQTSQWDGRFRELVIFHKEHGHLLVPHSYLPNPKLAQWVKRQRHQNKRKHMGHRSTLTDDREEKLLAVGFIFDSHRAGWYERFETLKAFYLAHGHCGIPAKFEDGSLNVWMKHQRRQYVVFMNEKKSTMTEERIAALNSIGFNWNPRKLLRLKKLCD
ncbi:helicase domain protein [Nitzschia inconspicua]|uniref:Helicase domain protein n=1 Tax=Nitzschia inconspicua TaxID=303405 RepID=A0A9K3M2T7_9STRA|nr:helicase domain protein [Nitzschia inconspicua]